MKSLLKAIQYDMLDFIETGDDDGNEPAYTARDVTTCMQLLLDFWTNIEAAEQDTEAAKTLVNQLAVDLKNCNSDCNHALIDEEQALAIEEFIIKVLREAKVEVTLAKPII